VPLASVFGQRVCRRSRPGPSAPIMTKLGRILMRMPAQTAISATISRESGRSIGAAPAPDLEQRAEVPSPINGHRTIRTQDRRMTTERTTPTLRLCNQRAAARPR
jgi:hypothetical protein